MRRLPQPPNYPNRICADSSILGKKSSQIELKHPLTRLDRALQSDRITVLVGSSKGVFKVSQDLLTQSSPFFEKSCSLPFKENAEKVIELPEDDSLIFEHFLIWLYSPTSYLPLDSNDDSLIRLGVFAEKYHIRLLINQISNILRKAITEGRWKPSPDIARRVYDSVPVKSILRRLCSLGLTVSLGKMGHRTDYGIWEAVFIEFADLGWDYFRRTQKGQTLTFHVSSNGACRFHDHSDVVGWVRKEVQTCPFPDGAPVVALKENTLPV